jgi:hypothetical protein
MGGRLGRCRRAARAHGVIARAVGAVDVHVPVHAILLRASGRAAEVYPAVGAVVFEVERLSGGLERLAVPAPALKKPVRAGGDPLVFAHGTKIVPCAIIVYLPWFFGTDTVADFVDALPDASLHVAAIV